eukprot:6197308-Pleurochrysis_carterae.AAC.1
MEHSGPISDCPGWPLKAISKLCSDDRLNSYPNLPFCGGTQQFVHVQTNNHPVLRIASRGAVYCVPCGPALHQIRFQPPDRFRRIFFVAFRAPFCHFGRPLDPLLPAPVA